ncbi:MAG: cell division protein FtsQ/DivIB [Hyphomicrobiaceae bacterium]|nr:cell division protein FtsQ/DivIB [Hyphomicrobiaceae bacterium]
MSQRWRGWSQKPGQRRARFALPFTVSRPWRIATVSFVCLAGVYGLAVGDYAGQTADFATKHISTIIVSAGFAVERVTIEGQKHTSDRDIARALGFDSRTSTLAFNTAAAKERLEQLPLIRRAQVMRLLPSQLHVVIEERTPYAVWQHKSALHLVDQDGEVLKVLKRRTYADLPLIVGDGAAASARELLDELAHWPQIKSKVQAAVRVADRRWNLKLENGLEVRLPEGDPARALKKVADLDTRHKILSGDAVSVDLRLADRVTIKLAPDAAKRRDSAFTPSKRPERRPGRET